MVFCLCVEVLLNVQVWEGVLVSTLLYFNYSPLKQPTQKSVVYLQAWSFFVNGFECPMGGDQAFEP